MSIGFRYHMGSGWSRTGTTYCLMMTGLLLLSTLFSMFIPSQVSADSNREEEGVWTSTKMWADTKLIYDAEVGDVWPGHAGNEVIVGGESNWTTMLYGHEDSWEALRLFREAWYVTNVAIGDLDPAEPGNEIVNVGWHGNVSMVFWEDSTYRWRHVELVNGLEAGLDWGYGVCIGDLDPRYTGNEVAVTDDLGQLMIIRKSGNTWEREVIWQEGGPGIIDPYLDTVLLADFDPEHDGDEILVTGGSRWITEIHYNGSDEWAVKRLWRDRLAPVQVEVADILDDHAGNEIAVVGLTNNLTVLHWNGTGWEGELVFTDDDVLYDVDHGVVKDGDDAHLVTGGWSTKVGAHAPGASPGTWDSTEVHDDDDFIFGVTLGDIDDLHSGNEIVVTDRAGTVTKVQYETPDFVLYVPGPETSANVGSSANFDIMVYSRAGFKEEVTLTVSGLPQGWSADPSPAMVTPSGISGLEVKVPLDAAQGTTRITITGKSVSKEHSVDVWVRVLPPGEKDFGLKGVPTSQSVVADYNVDYTIVSSSMNGFSEEVSLSVSGLPDGASATFSYDRMTPPDSVTLEVRTLASTPRGTSYLTVTGEGGGKNHVVTLALMVKDPDSPDFSIGVVPSTIEAVGSRSVEATVNVLSLYGFSDTVSLSASGMPDGMDVTFSPPSLVPTGKSMVNITTDAFVPGGYYYIVITGTSGGTVHSTTLRVNLNTMGDPDFRIIAYPGSTNVTASGSAYFNITISPDNDFGASVRLSVEGLPMNTDAVFTPPTVRPFEYSVLEIRTLVHTPVGTYDLVVKGEGSGIERETTISVQVLPARPLLNMIKLDGAGSGVQEGKKVGYQAWVENLGLVNATDVHIELLVDGKKVDDRSVSVTPGSGAVADLTWKAKEGEHNVTARIVPRADLDIETGSVTRTVKVSGQMTIEGGLWTWVVIAIVFMVLVAISVGYLIGKGPGPEKGKKWADGAKAKGTGKGKKKKGKSKKGKKKGKEKGKSKKVKDQ